MLELYYYKVTNLFLFELSKRNKLAQIESEVIINWAAKPGNILLLYQILLFNRVTISNASPETILRSFSQTW